MTIYLHFIRIFLTYTFEQFALTYFSVFLTGVYAAAHTLFRQGRECFGIATAEEDDAINPTACNCMSFIITKPTVFEPLCTPSLPLPGCLGLSPAAGLQTELALRQG